jgi:hypothetical protein
MHKVDKHHGGLTHGKIRFFLFELRTITTAKYLTAWKTSVILLRDLAVANFFLYEALAKRTEAKTPNGVAVLLCIYRVQNGISKPTW